MHRAIPLLLAVLLAACSTRVEYEQPRATDLVNAININTASVAELERLPGIGPKTAAAIVEHRTTHGPFRRVENLLLIRGVSEDRFLQIRPLLRVE